MDSKIGNELLEIVKPPLLGRVNKPRQRGLNIVIDKGRGLQATKDILELVADYVDFIKLGFGTAAFYPEEKLKEKIELIKSYNVDILPGGTFLEAAILQDSYQEFLSRVRELGFNTIEVSDGTIDISKDLRSKVIKRAINLDFKVFSEVGKKSIEDRLNEQQIIKQIKSDLADGAFKVIIEARESGQNVSIFDSKGQADEFKLKKIILEVNKLEDLIWEAPLKKQQAYFINLFGNNVNLANLKFDDIIAIEALRNGLRGDTLAKAINKKDNYSYTDILEKLEL